MPENHVAWVRTIISDVCLEVSVVGEKGVILPNSGPTIKLYPNLRPKEDQ